MVGAKDREMFSTLIIAVTAKSPGERRPKGFDRIDRVLQSLWLPAA